MCFTVMLQCRWVSEGFATIRAVISFLVAHFEVGSPDVSLQVAWMSELLVAMITVEPRYLECCIMCLHVVSKNTSRDKLFFTNFT